MITVRAGALTRPSSSGIGKATTPAPNCSNATTSICETSQIWCRARDGRAEPDNRWDRSGFNERPSEFFATFLKAGADYLGVNISTAGPGLERMPLGTLVELGRTAIVEPTGLRTPCVFIDLFQAGSNGRCSRRQKQALHLNAECWAWSGPAERSRLAIARWFGYRRLPFACCRLCRTRQEAFARDCPTA